MSWPGRRRRRGAPRGWHEDLLREIRALETTDPGHDEQLGRLGPVTPLPRRRPRRPRRPRARARVARRPGGQPTAERRRTIATVAVTLVVIVALGAVSLGPTAPVVRRLVGLGPSGGGDGHAYAFIHRDGNGRPVGFSTCHDVHVQVNPSQAPADWQSLVEHGLATVGAATGLRLVLDGTTTADDYFDRRSALTGSPEPVLIGWTTADRVHDLDGDVAGVTSSDYDPRAGHYDTGRVVLDADAYRHLATEPGGGAEEEAILLHELGHLVGLDHVDDPGELMYPTVGSQVTYADGDLAGLRQLGKVGC